MTQAIGATAAGRHLAFPRPLAIDARRALGLVSLVGIVATGLVVAAGAAGEPSSLVPGRKGGYPWWLHEPLSSLGFSLAMHQVVFAMLAMWVFYGLALAVSDAISTRHALTAIVALHVIFLLGPPLFSLDVFSYIEYGRLGVLHDLNPYLHTPSAVPGDAAFPFIGWQTATSVYGPVFTLSTYATAPLGVGGALWAMKAVTVGASLGCVALVWRAAELLGRRPLEAAMFFGLNPLLIVIAVGGVHNDVLMLAPALAGIVLVLERRERAGGLAAFAAVAIKASSAILLPYLLIGARRRGRFVLGTLAGAALAAATWTIAFHAEVGPFLEALRWQQHHGSLHSVPKALGSLVGVPIGNDWLRIVFEAVLGAVLAATLWRARRGGDWLVAAGWATCALLVTSAWLLPWYVIWLLPIAAVTGDRKLRIATLALSAFVIGMRLPFWLG
jgi:alpha-1,6-mannosyltransferase